MFKTKFARMRKSWVLGFILFICIGLIVISQLTFPQEAKKQPPVVPALQARHVQKLLCGPPQTIKVFVFYWKKCVPEPVKGALVEVYRGCKVIGSGTTNTDENGIAEFKIPVPCPPPHCYFTVKATYKDWTPYLGGIFIKKKKK